MRAAVYMCARGLAMTLEVLLEGAGRAALGECPPDRHMRALHIEKSTWPYRNSDPHITIVDEFDHTVSLVQDQILKMLVGQIHFGPSTRDGVRKVRARIPVRPSRGSLGNRVDDHRLAVDFEANRVKMMRGHCWCGHAGARGFSARCGGSGRARV